MTKEEVKHPHTGTHHGEGHHAPAATHIPAHHETHHASTIHYHHGPERHYHGTDAPAHRTAFTTPHKEQHFPHPHFEPRRVEHLRHRYNIVPHWNVGRPHHAWRDEHAPWRDESGVWHQDHRIFIDDDGVWWDDYGRWRDAEGFWHLPESPDAEVPPSPHYHPLDGILNTIIAGAVDYTTEKIAEESVKQEVVKEGEKND